MRKVLLCLSVVGLVALAARGFLTGTTTGYARPLDCVDAWHRAIKAADEHAYLNCLHDRLQSAVRERHGEPGSLARGLQSQAQDLRNWVIFSEEEAPPDRVTVWVDQQFSESRRRQKVGLERTGSSWRIAELAPSQVLSDAVPYGTHVSKVSDGVGQEAKEEAEPLP